MQRIQYHQYGGPEVMRLENFEPAEPGAGELRIRVRAAAANPMDWVIRNGAMKMVTGRTFPRAMGYDFAGVVDVVGEGVTRFRVGDEVMGGAPFKLGGAFAEMLIAEEKGVVDKPVNLSFEEAATFPTPALTARQALLSKGKLKPGQAVFVHGCLGAVGRSAVQIALTHGATVAGSCRADVEQDARDLGVSVVVGFDFDPAELAGQFDVVFDTAGKLAPRAARTLLKRGGRIVDIAPSPAKFARSALPGPFTTMVAQPVTADLEAVAKAAGAGTLRLPIGRTVPLSKAIPALIELERDRLPRSGKLVITVE